MKVSPDVDKIRTVVKKRLLDQPRIEAGMRQLNRMLLILRERGFVTLEPEPPPPPEPTGRRAAGAGQLAALNPPAEYYQPVRAVPTAGTRQAARVPGRPPAVRGVFERAPRVRRPGRAAAGVRVACWNSPGRC